ncbi:hypothetical protein [Brevibacillus borstelensis]|jgi:hypothetical protein|uniref:hypothetical protein n=1 Tax=Brevibacillus borstelensis TaxID=45462 RepID=UPI0015625037|nr:hypothetical protein [Brevibacillus borstelensis]MBE5394959.1 hypothetical protein [Brevibacillus borstelensis]MCM3622960.1 hypothetical protein [Brevibacillus borstelensis]MED1743438.1 hypothetical protein [Brevibacillus borstelensis]MED1876391.1 hypothetical protein [Brevibacillus borstelensis]MED2008353.1 hypothetical protein [Brevibacillus borstelensis]
MKRDADMGKLRDPGQLRAEIKRLESALAALRAQLGTAQKACDHDFLETPLSRMCRKCQWTESLYY